MLTTEFSEVFASVAGSRPLQAATIIAGTFILEDAATLLAAMQVAAGAVSLPLALAALYTGIVLGDLGLYGLGALSAKNKWAARLVPKRRQDLGHNWVSQRVLPLVIVSRFVPGLRLPTYTTLGFLRAPILQFAAAAIGRHPGLDLRAIFHQPEAWRIDDALSGNLALGGTRGILLVTYSCRTDRRAIL